MSSAISVVVQYQIDLIRADRSLGLHDVFYGDQTGIPKVPAVCIIPAPKSRAYTQTGLQTTVSLQTDVLVYHSRVADLQNILKENDERAEAIESLLNSDPTLGGLVINGLVTSMDPGYLSKGKVLFVAHHLSWEGLVKERVGV